MKIEHILEAKRKLFKFTVKVDDAKIDTIEASSYNEARSKSEKQFPDKQVTVSLVEDDATIEYLTKLSMQRVKAGEGAYSIAAPFTNVMFWKNPRDTHFMNIANMLPGPVKIAFLKELGEDEEIDNMSPYEKLGYFPGSLLEKYSDSERTPEVYEQIYSKLLVIANRSGLIDDGDIIDILYKMFEGIPADKWSPKLIALAQHSILNNEELISEYTTGWDYDTSDLPEYIRTQPFVISSIKKDPDMLFAWNNERMSPDLVNMAFKSAIKSGGGFTAMANDNGIDEASTYFSDEVLRDPTFRKLLHLYKQKFPGDVDTDEESVDNTYEGRPDPRIKSDDKKMAQSKLAPQNTPQSTPKNQPSVEPKTEPPEDTKLNEGIDRIKKLSGI